MALTWEQLKAFGSIIKESFAPTEANCVYDQRVIWINTGVNPNTAYLINGTTITPLPVTVGGSVPSTGASLSDLQAEITALENRIGPDPETVEKTISSGSITVEAGEKHIQLIGEGGAPDTLTEIAGGTTMDEITLWRKADIGYSIVVSSDSDLHLQRNKPLTINANHDNLTLVCKEPNVWIEKGGRVSAD